MEDLMKKIEELQNEVSVLKNEVKVLRQKAKITKIKVHHRWISHPVGDEGCRECYSKGAFPRRCECGGLIHVDMYNGPHDYDLYYKCDNCLKSGECETVESEQVRLEPM